MDAKNDTKSTYLRIAAVFGIILVLALMSGCVKMNLYQKIYSDGRSDIRMEYNMSALFSMVQSMNKSMTMADFDASLEKDSCANFTSTAGDLIGSMSGTSCKAKDGVLTQVGSVAITTGFSKEDTASGVIYTFTLPENATGSTGMDISSMKSMGVEMKWTVEMPGKIIETNGNQTGDNKVVFDLLEQKAGQRMYVKSQEAKMDIYVVAGIGVAIILAAAFILLRRKQSD